MQYVARLIVLVILLAVSAPLAAANADQPRARGLYYGDQDPVPASEIPELRQQLDRAPDTTGITELGEQLQNVEPVYETGADGRKTLAHEVRLTDGGMVCAEHRKTTEELLLCLQDLREQSAELSRDGLGTVHRAIAAFNRGSARGPKLSAKSLVHRLDHEKSLVEAAAKLRQELEAQCPNAAGKDRAACLEAAQSLWVGVIQSVSGYRAYEKSTAAEDKVLARNSLPKSLRVSTGAHENDAGNFTKKPGAPAERFKPEADLSFLGIGGSIYECGDDFPKTVECAGKYDPLSQQYSGQQDRGTLSKSAVQKAVDLATKTLEPDLRKQLAAYLFKRYVETYVVATLATSPSPAGYARAVKALGEKAELCGLHDTSMRELLRKTVRALPASSNEAMAGAVARLSPDKLTVSAALGLEALKYKKNQAVIDSLRPQRFEGSGPCSFYALSPAARPAEDQKQSCTRDWRAIQSRRAENDRLVDAFPVLREELPGLGRAADYIAAGSDTSEIQERAQKTLDAFAGTQKAQAAQAIDKLCDDASGQTNDALYNGTLMRRFFDCGADHGDECKIRRGLGWVGCQVRRKADRNKALKNTAIQMAAGQLLAVFPYSFALVEPLGLAIDYADRASYYDDMRSFLLSGAGGAHDVELARERLDDFETDALERALFDSFVAGASHAASIGPHGGTAADESAVESKARPPKPRSGGVFENVLGSVADRAVKIAVPLMKNLTGRELELTATATGKAFKLKLGKSFGAGFFGRVYAVEGEPGPELIGDFHGKVCAKLGHGLKGTSGADPLGYTRKAIVRENAKYTELKGMEAKIKSLPDYPKDPAFEGLPVVPILKVVDTDQGPVMFKPIVRGRTFESLSSMGELTPEMRAGIKDILGYIKATDAAAKAETGKAFSTDLRPTNIVWVDDPALLKELHYSRPGWILYEQDTLPMGSRHYLEMDLDSYLAEAQRYVGRSAQ